VAGATPAPWWLVLGQGAAFVAAALVLLTQTGEDHLLTFIVLLGVCWLVAGGLDLADLWLDRRGWAWKLLGAIAGFGAALLVLRQPLWSTLLVPATLLSGLGAFGVAIGVLGVVRGVGGGGRELAGLGCLSLVMGVLLLVSSPVLVVWGGAALAAFGGAGGLVAGIHMRRARDSRAEARRARELAG
jgi:hypothetical protein